MIRKPERPIGVAIAAIILIIYAMLGFLRSAQFVGLGGVGFLSELVLTNALGAVAAVFGGVIFLFALFTLLLGWGIWNGEGWGWSLGVSYYILWAILALIWTAVGAWVLFPGLLLAGGISFYLLAPDVQEFFRGQA